MNDDLLQEHLSRLEAGEPLENVLAGLPPDEAELVRMACALRTLPHPARAANSVAAQRARLMNSAQGGMTMNPTTPSKRWIWAGAALVGAACVFMCVIAVSGAGALWLWRSSGGPAPVAVQAPDPQTAILSEARGLVEVQTSAGEWKVARAGEVVAAGQRLRTGALSSAALSFHDGSRAVLGPNAEVVLNTVDARATGRRVVKLTQVAGDTDHQVAKSSHPESVYEVVTPAGTGRAKGTAFHVSVSSSLLVRFAVSEGAVTVTNMNVTVVVGAGQTTIVTGDEAPAPPVAGFSGEGEVQAIGAPWVIAGQSMLVDPGTLIDGDPQPGDWVSFEGRILPGGARVADRITLLHRAVTNTLTFIGTVDVISDTTWIISGRSVKVVPGETEIDDGVVPGDQVDVTGRIEADGTILATQIRLFTEGPGAPFEFTGVVESISPESWVISAISVTVISATIEPGIAVGDVVHVAGTILENGTWQAETIEAVSETGAFEFTGIVISTDPWNVSGTSFETDANTEIDDDIQTGNRVRVQGQVLADGSWLAERITQLDQGRRHAVQFTAHVQSIDPWVVGGVTVTVDDKTKIIGDIAPGDLVTVKGSLLPDGAVIARKITLVAAGSGCAALTATVTGVTSDTITLEGGQAITLTTSITVTGEIEVGSVIEVVVCADDEGTEVVVSITVLSPPEPTPQATPAGAPTAGAGTSEKVTICHLPGGDAAKARTLSVGADAVPGHLAHGDTLGACPAPPEQVIPTPGPASEAVPAAGAGADEKVTICHQSGGNPAKGKTLSVSPGAVAAHLAHGDTLGECPATSGGPSVP